MKRLVLIAAAALAGCATQKLAVPTADAYGALANLSPDSDESALLDSVDDSLQNGGHARAVRDPAVLAATRARCNAMAESDEYKPPSAAEAAAMLNAAGVADLDYQVVDIPGPFAKHGLSDDDLKDAVAKFAGTPGPILAGACVLSKGIDNKRLFSVTLVARRAALSLPRTVAENADVAITATPSPDVTGVELYVLDPAGHASALTGGSFHAAAKGRYVVEAVGSDGGYQKILARAAFFAGGAAEAFPAKLAEPEKKDDSDKPKKAADVAALIARIASEVRGSALAASDSAQKLADADVAARAVEKPDNSPESVAARVREAGVQGASIVAGQVMASDLPMAEALWRASPFLMVAAKDRALAVAAKDVPKGHGAVAYAIVLGPQAAPAPAPAPTPVEVAPPAAAAPDHLAPGSAAPEHAAPGSSAP